MRLRREGARRADLLGESLVALCGGALALNLLLVLALIGLLGSRGLAAFWPRAIDEIVLADGTRLLGEAWGSEHAPAAATAPGVEPSRRIQLKLGNRDLGGAGFRWIEESAIVSRARPIDAVVVERLEWGNFYGRLVALRRGESTLAEGEGLWRAFDRLLEEKRAERDSLHEFEHGPMAEVNRAIEKLRLAERRLELEGPPESERAARAEQLARALVRRQAEYEALEGRLFARRAALESELAVFEAIDGRRVELAVGQIVRAVRPNRLDFAGRARVYLARIGEFLAADPRESNTEGGIFPAIFGTVMMVFLMTFAVTPLGVLAALYLREYAAQGPLVRVVRIAVNNLAGVPSIVFGVFGLGFFVYLVGGGIDRLFFPEALPAPTYGTGGILWSALTLALLTVPVVIVAAEEGLAAVPRVTREGSLALGATKFETTWRVVLPAAAPGILTGMILAMARAAGEVAPLMIVGMVKLAPSLPVDGQFPFIHLERKFMHLGFHIYDVGFQSPDVEATKPLVFATAFLLILVVAAMNLVATAVRNHLRRKYASSAL